MNLIREYINELLLVEDNNLGTSIKTFRGRLPPEGPYYHGTSTALNITDNLLPPSETGKQTERRVQRKGKIFLTTDLEYAKSYAERAVKVWGGKPVVFEVIPIENLKQMSGRPGQSVFHSTKVKIKQIVA